MSKKALIIEDDSSIGHLVEKMLSKMDYECTYVASAEMALDILEHNSFLVVITDYCLPNMSGISLMETVKKTNPHQNFIIMSGLGHKIAYQEILNAGASDYIKKPFEFSEFASRILRIEREYEILKELNETNTKLEKVLNSANVLTNDILYSQHNISNLLNSITEPSVIIDKNMNILKVNDAFLSLFSISDTQLEGKNCQEAFPAAFCIKKDCLFTFNSLEKIEETKDYFSPENIRIPLTITCFPIKDNNGQVIGVLKSFKDLRDRELEKDKRVVWGMLQVSAKEGREKVEQLNKVHELIDKYYRELKQTERKLRSSEKELRLLNQISRTILTRQDNTMFEDILTLLLKEFDSIYGLFGYIDSHNKMILPLTNKHLRSNCKVNPETIPLNHAIINQWKVAIETKKSICLKQQFNFPEGHISIHSMIVVPVISKDDIIGMICLANKANAYTSTDKSRLETVATFIAPVLQSIMKQQQEELERIKAEKALTISHAYREKIIQSMRDPLLVIDIDGNIKQLNEATLNLFGYELSELENQPFSTLLIEKTVARSVSHFSLPFVLIKLSEESHINDYELLCQDKNGNLIPVIVSGNVLTDETHNVTAFVCILRDIRGLQETTSRLIEAEKLAALSELTGGIGHELKQPMNVIKIITQSILMDIKRGRFEQDLLGDDLKQISSQVDKMANIIDHMRIFTGRSHDMERENVNVNELVETTFQFFSQQMKAHSITFRMNLQTEIAMVKANKIRLEEVLINLISNARKALEKSNVLRKSIIVHTRNADDFVFLEVQDNGCGVPEHLADKLFDQFFTTQIPGEGMGLGLSISRKIIQDHNGTLTFHNISEGGAVFQIKLPVIKD